MTIDYIQKIDFYITILDLQKSDWISTFAMQLRVVAIENRARQNSHMNTIN